MAVNGKLETCPVDTAGEVVDERAGGGRCRPARREERVKLYRFQRPVGHHRRQIAPRQLRPAAPQRGHGESQSGDGGGGRALVGPGGQAGVHLQGHPALALGEGPGAGSASSWTDDQVVCGEVGRFAGRSGAAQVGGRSDQETRRLAELAGQRAGVRQGAEPEGQVRPFGHQILPKIADLQVYAQLRMALQEGGKPGDDLTHAEARGQGDANQPAQFARAPGGVIGFVERGQQGLDARQIVLADLGQLHRPGGSRQQRSAHLALKAGQDPRHRGLGEAELPRGAGEASAPGGADEGSQRL